MCVFCHCLTMCQFRKHVQCLVLQFLIFFLCVRVCCKCEEKSWLFSSPASHKPMVHHSWCLCLWVCVCYRKYKSVTYQLTDVIMTRAKLAHNCLETKAHSWFSIGQMNWVQGSRGMKSSSIILEQKLWDVWQSSCKSCVSTAM